jgi:hypothetical protein
VKAICDLLGLGRSQRCALGIEAAPIAGDRRDFRMALEPLREAFRHTIRQELDNPVEVQIHQDRSVVLAFAPRPIVDSQVAYRDRDLRRFLSDPAQNRVIAGGDCQSSEQPLAGKTAGYITDQPHDLSDVRSV